MTALGWLDAGQRLAVHGAGNGAPMLVFQHGLCGDARQVAEVMQELPGQSWRCVECPGHGASAPVPDPSIAGFADHVIGLIETLDAPVVLGGISMGAAIACRVAVRRPDLVRGLVLVRPAWVAEDAPDSMAPNAEVGACLAAQAPDQARARFAASATAQRLAQDAPDNLASLMGFFDRAPQDTTARLLTMISADGPGIAEADLRALNLPVLVCGTGRDAIHPVAHAQRLADLIPGARLMLLPPKAEDKAAHLAALGHAINQFLKEI